MKNLITLLISTFVFPFFALPVFACITCNRPLYDLVFNERFFTQLTYLFLPFPIFGIIAAVLYSTSAKHPVEGRRASISNAGPLTGAGLMIGVGMGGFVDGILFHQILQWHQMLSNIIPPDTLIHKQINTFWDGMFHAFTWLFTFIGMVLLWNLHFKKDAIISTKIFIGSLLMGWGIFNVTEGFINHYLLKLHNVREVTSHQDVYNNIFIGVSIIVILLAWSLIRTGKREYLYKNFSI
jgi:uncharacterized membrane protein